MKFIDLDSQYIFLKERINKRIQKVLDHGQYILGPEVEELERKLEEYIGVKHVITCANGTDALTLAMMALDVKEGDAIFCPTFTFFATAETIAHARATPIFVDSNKHTFNICTIDLENQIKDVVSKGVLKPKAIIPVDLFGLPANYKDIIRIAHKYNLKIIEDAAQGLGGSFSGKRAASFGHISTTSFFPAKPLGCYGDGGAIFTDNDDYAELLKSLRFHGRGKDKYDNVRIGLNSRLDTIQAAVLLEKLAVFDEELEKRNAVAEFYNEILSEYVNIPIIPDQYYSSYAQYTVRTARRADVIAKLNIAKIPYGIYYPKCLHKQEAFNRKDKFFPAAEKLSDTCLSLPMGPYIKLSNNYKDSLWKVFKR